MIRTQEQGFTLLEMMLALAVFAALSVAASQVLNGVIKNDEASARKEARLAELQRAFSLIERDFSQIVPRRSQGYALGFFAERYQLGSNDWAVSFVRSGWLNPLGILPRSELQRVGYRVRDGQLERLFYDSPEPATSQEAAIRPLLTQVDGFTLHFFGRSGWQDRWGDAKELPDGIAVVVTLRDYGEITRVFLLTHRFDEKRDRLSDKKGNGQEKESGEQSDDSTEKNTSPESNEGSS
ncbi:type II secretion system minor pseudopilin GspJ [Musicola paradisiaca]|uniref:Type II secretion system protein J n=1 Tax=Musicola paradisiaca (strain Ech703) TaxID=579405 RepID=C6C311_MUSP7|nr:type II secretion system minor pseudopilin GspJ [Musicola paradisiaca]ACS85276.1 general secretion pathway protein J [Musicola paradisiaca Ech703]